MNEVSHHAMTMALDFLRGDATVTVDGLISTATKIREFLGGAANEAASAEDAPKGRRRTAAKTTGETETGTASEPAPSDKPTLVAADEGNDTSSATTGSAQTSVQETPAAETASPSEATQEDKDALLAEATTFSQKHGHEALLAALKAVGAERFSAIPFEKYGDFRAAMSAHGIGASALS